MNLTLIHDAPIEDDDATVIPKGTTVVYLAHLPGGIIKVRWGMRVVVIDPRTTKELS